MGKECPTDCVHVPPHQVCCCCGPLESAEEIRVHFTFSGGASEVMATKIILPP